jgi:hypothetical protein
VLDNDAVCLVAASKECEGSARDVEGKACVSKIAVKGREYKSFERDIAKIIEEGSLN